MPASQFNAQIYNPNSLNLVEVAAYDRLIDAPLVRVWENVLDWEHLPYLHDSSFDYVALDEAGDWGWRAWSNAAHTDYIELTVAAEHHYVARSYQDGRQVTEIWTTVVAVGEQTRIHVEFHLPDIVDDVVAVVGDAMVSLYARLWDEDEAMMRQRHFRLQEQRDGALEVDLGSEVSLLTRLDEAAPVVFQLQRREYQLRKLDGDFVAHATICPHLLGPLTNADIATGRLRCPWHGYEFDLVSGECTFPVGASCTLAPAPILEKRQGRIIARS